ncbi:MAG TPA: protein kinase, partial [Polyangiales bacterium]
MTLRTGAARMLDAGSRYRPLKALGEGSFGAVYCAELVGTEQQVALKSLTRVKPEALLSFKREFRALSEVSHPNLVGLRELFEHEGHWFIAMDLVEGTDLLSWVRKSANDNGFDEARLRRAFADITQGLAALHSYGLLHRDLKPSNARVTPEGKAVVLDFGLVTMADEAMQSTQRAGVGTLAYMAPEQLAPDRLTPAADFYALGASLYEALTGRLPLEAESPFSLMLRKANEDPVPPRRLAPQVPFELDGLCMALLDRNPKARPSAETVLRTLLGAHETARSVIPARASENAEDAPTALEGREAELAQLDQALARTHEGELSLVFVEGESGMGKSALVAEFVRHQVTREPETWVLSGRCYEHERVPYKAFDACMDALARRLGKLSPELCRAVLPRRAALLLELFPALGAVKGLGERPAHGAPAEPTARRLEAFSVLGELLGKLAEARPLVVAIDDLQWADEESLRLLRHLANERPPPIMLVSTVRPTRELNPTVQKALEELRSASGARWLSLKGLQQEAIEAIAHKVLGEDSSPKAIAQLAYESAGHPMLLAELCHYAKAHGVPGQRLTLDAALNARLLTLSAPARRLLEALALCGRPHGEAFLQKLQPSAAFGDALKELMGQRFARRDAGHEIAISHDRVRNAALARLDDEQRADLHRTLAQALESRRSSEPSELAEHWDRSGDKARASQYYIEAATQALKALAFGNAAEHYA